MRVMVMTLMLIAVDVPAWAQAIPRAAHLYRRSVTQEVRLVWGLNAPTAAFFAQLHQESGFRADAKSAYAGGLAQFTNSTAVWLSEIYPDLGKAAPFEPEWAIRGFVRYNKHIFDRVAGVVDECQRTAMLFSAYNGGAGNLSKQRRAAAAAGANPNRWFGSVEYFRVRATWAHTENTAYPRRILLVLQSRYVAALWGRGVDCKGVK